MGSADGEIPQTGSGKKSLYRGYSYIGQEKSPLCTGYFGTGQKKSPHTEGILVPGQEKNPYTNFTLIVASLSSDDLNVDVQAQSLHKQTTNSLTSITHIFEYYSGFQTAMLDSPHKYVLTNHV
ncbi:hypothetical protein BsWGS_00998 [Bradybaena similaris]